MKKLHVINIRVDGETKEKLQEMAAADHRSVSDFIRLQLERLSQISQILTVSPEMMQRIPGVAENVTKAFWAEKIAEIEQKIEEKKASQPTSDVGRKVKSMDIKALEKQLQELKNKI